MAEFEKMDLASADLVAERIEQLKQLLPEVATEGGIDFDKLRLVLGDEVDEGTERYAFTWPGKTDAIRQSQTPSTATLRPCPEESVNWDETENLYIEGDNLEVLKLLQHSYHGRIKMIYIDPPYNTGHDFIYKDSFSNTIQNYREQAGLTGQSNADTNGRYHSDWCSMMYPRLRLARELLTDDGVVFISIGQDEEANLTTICDEIFGAANRLGIISHQMKAGGGTQGKFFAHNVDYVLVYAKTFDEAKYFRGEMSDELVTKVYNQVQKDGPRRGEKYRTMGLFQASLGIRPSLRYYIKCPDGTLVIPPGKTFPIQRAEGALVTPVEGDGCWRWSYERYTEEAAKGNVEFKRSKQGVLLDDKGNASEWNVYTKIWLTDRQEEGTIPNDFLDRFENRHSSKELRALDIPFDFAKPVGLIRYLIYIMQQSKEDIVLDFFSGSATTAHAVMQINAEDSLRRKFIMVQLPEKCDEKSLAGKAGYNNICEIGEERIRRAGAKIAASVEESNRQLRLGEEPRPVPDIGFRVLKLDESGIERPEPGELLLDVVKPDRSDEDIIFEMMLKWGLELTLPIEKVDAAGYPCYSVAYGELVCCLADGLNMQVLDAIADMEPRRVLMLDRILDDTTKLNAVQAFKRVEEKTGREVELRTV